MKKLDMNKIIHLYTVEELSLYEIADIMDVHFMTISRRLKKAGVQTRTISEARRVKVKHGTLPKFHQSKYSYAVENIIEMAQKMSYKEIADYLGCHENTVGRLLYRAYQQSTLGGKNNGTETI